MTSLEVHIPSAAELTEYPGWWFSIVMIVSVLASVPFASKIRPALYTAGVAALSCVVISCASYQVHYFTHKIADVAVQHTQIVYWSLILTAAAAFVVAWIYYRQGSTHVIEKALLNIGAALAVLVILGSIRWVNGLVIDWLDWAGLCAVLLGALSAPAHAIIMRRWAIAKVRRRYPEGLDTPTQPKSGDITEEGDDRGKT